MNEVMGRQGGGRSRAPWWVWLVAGIIGVMLVASGQLNSMLTPLIAGFADLLPRIWALLLIGGVVWAAGGLGYLALHHDWTAKQGRHMAIWGGIAAGIGALGIVGGLDIALSVLGAIGNSIATSTHFHASPASVTLQQIVHSTPTPLASPIVAGQAHP